MSESVTESLGRGPAQDPVSEGMLVHVGLCKAGSTWLQNFLFNRADLGYEMLPRRGIVKSEISMPHPLAFEPQHCRNAFEPEIQRIRNKGLIPVISSEDIAGTFETGGYDAVEKGIRIARSFPNARILFVIREQRSMIFSCYNQYLKGSCTVTLEEYLNPPRPPHGGPFFSLDWLCYHYLIKRYQSWFGPARVLVVPYEMLRQEPEEFVGRIIDFSGGTMMNDINFKTQIKKSWPVLPLVLKRPFNLFLVRNVHNGYSNLKLPLVWIGVRYAMQYLINPLTPEAFNRPIERRWRRIIAEMTEGYFEESNRETSQLIGIDLAKYGYGV